MAPSHQSRSDAPGGVGYSDPKELGGTMPDHTAENILARLSDLENNPHETVSPYLEFNVEGELYYFTPGGFLYRRAPGTDEEGGFFCGYLADEVWRYEHAKKQKG